jgi:hypothetical protein
LQSHEYSVVGHSRTTVGRYLGMAAAAVAAASASLSVALADAFTSLGLTGWEQQVGAVSITAALAYAGIHWGFNKFGWKQACWFMQFPNIDGVWECKGETWSEDGAAPAEWSGSVTVSQTWEKLRVHLRTKQSSSNSVSAALVPEPDGSWMLLYSYRNEPRIGEPAEMKPHLGYCEMRFAPDLRHADGDYFNVRGRRTAGRMTLTRRD